MYTHAHTNAYTKRTHLLVELIHCDVCTRLSKGFAHQHHKSHSVACFDAVDLGKDEYTHTHTHTHTRTRAHTHAHEEVGAKAVARCHGGHTTGNRMEINHAITEGSPTIDAVMASSVSENAP